MQAEISDFSFPPLEVDYGLKLENWVEVGQLPDTTEEICTMKYYQLERRKFPQKLSGTHAGRYGSYEEYLVEEALEDIGVNKKMRSRTGKD